MKLLISGSVAAALVLCITACQSDADRELRQQEVREKADAVIAGLNAQILEQRTRYVRLKFGDSAASTYELCHKSPPKTAAHQQECKSLNDRVEQAMKHEPKW